MEQDARAHHFSFTREVEGDELRASNKYCNFGTSGFFNYVVARKITANYADTVILLRPPAFDAAWADTDKLIAALSEATGLKIVDLRQRYKFGKGRQASADFAVLQLDSEDAATAALASGAGGFQLLPYPGDITTETNDDIFGTARIECEQLAGLDAADRAQAIYNAIHTTATEGLKAEDIAIAQAAGLLEIELSRTRLEHTVDTTTTPPTYTPKLASDTCLVTFASPMALDRAVAGSLRSGTPGTYVLSTAQGGLLTIRVSRHLRPRVEFVVGSTIVVKARALIAVMKGGIRDLRANHNDVKLTPGDLNAIADDLSAALQFDWGPGGSEAHIAQFHKEGKPTPMLGVNIPDETARNRILGMITAKGGKYFTGTEDGITLTCENFHGGKTGDKNKK